MGHRRDDHPQGTRRAHPGTRRDRCSTRVFLRSARSGQGRPVETAGHPFGAVRAAIVPAESAGDLQIPSCGRSTSSSTRHRHGFLLLRAGLRRFHDDRRNRRSVAGGAGAAGDSRAAGSRRAVRRSARNTRRRRQLRPTRSLEHVTGLDTSKSWTGVLESTAWPRRTLPTTTTASRGDRDRTHGQRHRAASRASPARSSRGAGVRVHGPVRFHEVHCRQRRARGHRGVDQLRAHPRVGHPPQRPGPKWLGDGDARRCRGRPHVAAAEHIARYEGIGWRTWRVLARSRAHLRRRRLHRPAGQPRPAAVPNRRAPASCSRSATQAERCRRGSA